MKTKISRKRADNTKTMDDLLRIIKKMNDGERVAFLLLEILRVQGDVLYTQKLIRDLLEKQGLRTDKWGDENIHIAMKNRAEAIVGRESPLRDKDFDRM